MFLKTKPQNSRSPTSRRRRWMTILSLGCYAPTTITVVRTIPLHRHLWWCHFRETHHRSLIRNTLFTASQLSFCFYFSLNWIIFFTLFVNIERKGCRRGKNETTKACVLCGVLFWGEEKRKSVWEKKDREERLNQWSNQRAIISTTVNSLNQMEREPAVGGYGVFCDRVEAVVSTCE